MDQSRRAVEAYWRSRMVDAVTADEDKVAAVYRLEELSELLRSSDASIVKELSDYLLKRLDHKSPVVKQKALRAIKYCVGKSGTEFRREMQRHSTAVRQLVHYKGQPDPLKGDALNKSVRETANEAVAAIFATDDSKPAAPVDSGLGKRIQGFGNTNYEPPKDEKKSFLSEAMDLGTASIKQGLATFSAAHSAIKNDNNGAYKSPTLQRSLTTESNRHNRYGGFDSHSNSFEATKNVSSGTWSQDSRTAIPSSSVNDDSGSSNSGVKSREERLLETVVTSSGVRLQPTRDVLQVFLHEASKLDALAMSHALELKLQSPIWQVRMKAVCVLESILKRKDDEPFNIIASYFSENTESLAKCCELPQLSLSEKATKVLSLLGGEQSTGTFQAESSAAKPSASPVIDMPDLIDTGDVSTLETDHSILENSGQFVGNLTSPSSPIDDLFGNQPTVNVSTTNNDGGDPFADVSFLATEDKKPDSGDLFSGLTVDEKLSDSNIKLPPRKPEFVDLFGVNTGPVDHEPANRSVNELISGLSLTGTSAGQSGGVPSGSNVNVYGSTGQPSQNSNMNAFPGVAGPNAFYPQPPVQFNMSPQILFNQAYAGQQLNYGGMGTFIAQQQLLQNFGSFNPGIGSTTYSSMDNGKGSVLPDIFNVNNHVQSHVAVVSNTKKEDTKAFDFVSDHLAAARGSKKLV